MSKSKCQKQVKNTSFSECFESVQKVHSVEAQQAQFEVKMGKTPYFRSAFASSDIQIIQQAPLWHETHFDVNMQKHHTFGPLLEAEMPKKCAL